MKESRDNDAIKDLLKSKMDDSPIYNKGEEELWSKVIEEIENEEQSSENKIRKFYPLLRYATAAMLMIGLAISFFFWKLKNDDSTLSVKTSKPKSVEIPVSDKAPIEQNESSFGQKIKDTVSKSELNKVKESSKPTILKSKKKVLEYDLPDGSHLTLNQDAAIEYKDDFKSTRSLTLKGEAYFEVKKDKSRPFNIYFNSHRLVVVGTKFNIRNISNEHNIEVSVTEGIVMVYPGNKQKGITVKAGEQLKINENENAVLVKVDPLNFIAWKTGILDFKNTSMQEAVILMSRKYNHAIHVNAAIEKCTFTGDLTQLNLDDAINIIEITTSFKIEKRKNEIFISGESCK